MIRVSLACDPHCHTLSHGVTWYVHSHHHKRTLSPGQADLPLPPVTRECSTERRLKRRPAGSRQQLALQHRLTPPQPQFGPRCLAWMQVDVVSTVPAAASQTWFCSVTRATAASHVCHQSPTTTTAVKQLQQHHQAPTATHRCGEHLEVMQRGAGQANAAVR